MAHSRAILTVFWANPFTQPPTSVDTLSDGRTLWACTVLDRAQERAVIAAYAPQIVPGSGWSHGWSPVLDAPKRWSGARKAATRRRNLRDRLQKAVPLFADQLEAEELARRPGYFDADAIAAQDAARDAA